MLPTCFRSLHNSFLNSSSLCLLCLQITAPPQLGWSLSDVRCDVLRCVDCYLCVTRQHIKRTAVCKNFNTLWLKNHLCLGPSWWINCKSTQKAFRIEIKKLLSFLSLSSFFDVTWSPFEWLAVPPNNEKILLYGIFNLKSIWFIEEFFTD